MSYRLFLDDFRQPYDAGNYMPVAIRAQYRNENWEVVRSYPEFVKILKDRGIPSHVSFDHDLIDAHYVPEVWADEINYDGPGYENDSNKTGYHCARALIHALKEANASMPAVFVHSMNPIGTENIIRLLNSYT